MLVRASQTGDGEHRLELHQDSAAGYAVLYFLRRQRVHNTHYGTLEVAHAAFDTHISTCRLVGIDYAPCA